MAKQSGGHPILPVAPPPPENERGLRNYMVRRTWETIEPEYNQLRSQIQGADLSPDVKQRLLGMGGGTPAALNALKDEYTKVISGAGNYGAIGRNWKFLALSKDRPGSNQLFASTATRQQASTGILTGNSQGLLSRK